MTLPEQLAALIRDDDTSLFGEIVISRCPDTKQYRAIHLDDRSTPESSLTELSTISEIEELARCDKNGNDRPLKTAPTLRANWIIRDNDIESFYNRIDAIYPDGFADTANYYSGKVGPTAFRKTLDISTEAGNTAKHVTDTQINRIMRDTCAKGCLRKISWPIDESCPVSRLPAPDRKIPIVCLQACPIAVLEAVKLAD